MLSVVSFPANKKALSFLICFLVSFAVHALSLNEGATIFPQNEGDRARYNVQIDFKKAYISGVCIMLMEDGQVKASVVNEFGVSALDFSYNPSKKKVKILSVMGKMNKWYIKKVLRKDLQKVMQQLPLGDGTYEDVKFGIKYTFSPLDETKE